MESIAAYERERDLINAGIEYLPQAELFYKRNRKVRNGEDNEDVSLSLLALRTF